MIVFFYISSTNLKQFVISKNSKIKANIDYS